MLSSVDCPSSPRINRMEKKIKKGLIRILALGSIVFLSSCGSYSKAITIAAAKNILEAASAYSAIAEMDGKSYKMHSEVLTKRTDGFLVTDYSSIVTDVTYYFDILASDAWTTWKVTYNKVTKSSPNLSAASANYVVTRDSTGNNHFVSDNGAAPRNYDAVKDSFLANYFHLPEDIIRQDSLISAKYAQSLLSSVGMAADGLPLPNKLSSYSTISSGGSDLAVDFTGTEFDFSTLFSEESVSLSNASRFFAHFNNNFVYSLGTGYDFSSSGASSATSTPGDLPEGDYIFSVTVAFGT